MNILVLTNPGMEDITAKEIKHLGAENISTQRGRTTATIKPGELNKIAYHGRTFTAILNLIGKFTFKEKPHVYARLQQHKDKIKNIVNVKCQRAGKHAFTSQEIAEETISQLRKTGYTIDRKKPETTIHVLIEDNECLISIDPHGFDLARRDYRIFLGRNSLKGNIAAGLLSMAGYKNGEVLIDPCCKHGIIPIEAALYATNTSVHKYSKAKFGRVEDHEQELKGRIWATDADFPHIQSAKKNAKLAGVNKLITFSKKSMEQIDTNFKPESADKIITFPKQPSNRIKEKSIEEYYKMLFDKAKKILKKNGKMLVVMKQKPGICKKAAEGFELEHERKIMQGKEELNAIILRNRV